MQEQAKNFLSNLLAVALIMAAVHAMITVPANQRSDQRLSRIEQRLDRVDDRIDSLGRNMEARFRDVDRRFDGLEKTLDERVDRIESDLEITSKRLDWEQERQEDQP